MEIEVKFFVDRPQALRQRVLAIDGASCGRVFEHNEIFDDARRSLAGRGELLRLRQDTACRLTYKQPDGAHQDQFKILREMETTVAEGQVLRAVFKALGLEKVLVYEKWRETFTMGTVHLCLDEMPFGHFLEIEGPPADIRRTADALALPWSRRILGNYHQLFAAIAEAMGLQFSDITFENFRDLAVDASIFRRRFEAGEKRHNAPGTTP